MQPYINPALIAFWALAGASALTALLAHGTKRPAQTICAVVALASAACATSWPRVFKMYLNAAHREELLMPAPSLHMAPYFFDPGRFAFLAPLRESWELLAQEARRAMDTAPVLEHVHRSASQWVGDDAFFADQLSEYGWVRAWQSAQGQGAANGPNSDWLNYGLLYKGEHFKANVAACPTLVKVLEPSWRHRINICGFSWMRPLTKIHRHVDSTGVKHGTLAYHLGLIVPSAISGACKLTLGNVAVAQRQGQPIIF